MRKIMILLKSFVAVILIVTICFGESKDITVDDVWKVKSIHELRNYLGIDDWGIKKAILKKLDQFKSEDANYEKVEMLYLLYMQEETEENNKIEHVGGLPPMHIRIQIEVLERLMHLPVEKAREKILDIVEGYLISIDGMDYQEWRISPKQALQISIAYLLGTFIEDESIREMGHRYLQSELIKEYARARLVIPLLEYKVSKVPEQEDQECTKRIEMILEAAVKPELRQMLYCPKRLHGCAEIMKRVLKNDLTKLDVFIVTHTELGQPAKYFLHFFVVRCLLEKSKSGLKLSDKEMNRLNKAVDFWVKIYPSVIMKEKYASDPLNRVVSEIVEKIDDQALKKTITDCKNRTMDLMEEQ